MPAPPPDRPRRLVRSLLASAGCDNQAWAMGKHLAMQCHIEMTEDLVKSWCTGGADEIAGYVTRGRGVSIHRVNCSNLLALTQREPERVVEVAAEVWGGA